MKKVHHVLQWYDTLPMRTSEVDSDTCVRGVSFDEMFMYLRRLMLVAFSRCRPSSPNQDFCARITPNG